MTFDEDELRAALREGEGDPVSAGHILALAQARQRRRHERLRTVAVAVVVVGAIGSGVGALSRLGGDSESAGSASAGGGAAMTQNRDAYSGASGAQGSAPEPLAPGSAPASAGASQGLAGSSGGDIPARSGAGTGGSGTTAGDCPSTVPAVRRPSPGAPGSSGALFAEPVASLTVCSYRARNAGRRPVLDGRVVLNGEAARRVSDGLNAASTRFQAISCPGDPYSTALALYAETAAGRSRAVVVTLSCGATATNGTAVRYGWTPPAGLDALIH